MRLILECSSTNENYNGNCDFGYVDLTPDLAATALRRLDALAELKKADSQAYEVYYWDYSCTYHETDEEIDELCGGYSGLPVDAENYEPSEETAQRTECDQMVVEEDGIRWMTIPKHSDVYITTLTIPAKMLKKAARSKVVTQGGAHD